MVCLKEIAKIYSVTLVAFLAIYVCFSCANNTENKATAESIENEEYWKRRSLPVAVNSSDGNVKKGEAHKTIEKPVCADSIFQIGRLDSVSIIYSDSTLQLCSKKTKIASDTFRPNLYPFRFENIDIDFDGHKELITYSHFNMNGNEFCDIYDYNDSLHKFEYTGSLVGGFSIDKQKERIYTFYEGSWYMDVSYKELKWVDQRLIISKGIWIKKKYEEYERQNEKLLVYREFDYNSKCVVEKINQDFDSVTFRRLLKGMDGDF